MKIKGFDCRDAQCPKRWCWAPGRFEHRGATLSGSRNTGTFSSECLNRAYRGCPQPIPEPKQTLEQYNAARAAEREANHAPA